MRLEMEETSITGTICRRRESRQKESQKRKDEPQTLTDKGCCPSPVNHRTFPDRLSASVPEGPRVQCPSSQGSWGKVLGRLGRCEQEIQGSRQVWQCTDEGILTAFVGGDMRTRALWRGQRGGSLAHRIPRLEGSSPCQGHPQLGLDHPRESLSIHTPHAIPQTQSGSQPFLHSWPKRSGRGAAAPGMLCVSTRNAQYADCDCTPKAWVRSLADG